MINSLYKIINYILYIFKKILFFAQIYKTAFSEWIFFDIMILLKKNHAF